MNKYIKDFYWVIPLFLVLSIPMLYVLEGGFYSIWDINIPPINPELQLEKYFFINSPSSIGGRDFNLSPYLPLIAETWFFSLFMPTNWANVAVFYLHYFLTGLSMYVLISYFFDYQILKRKATLAAIVGGILAMFNEYWFLRAHYNFNIIFLTAFAPLIAMYLHKLCMEDGRIIILRNIAYILFFSFFMIPAFGNLPVTITFSLAMLIFCLATVFFNRRKFSVALCRLIILAVLGAAMHSWWIYPSTLNEASIEALAREGDYVEDTLESLRINSSDSATLYSRIMIGKGYFIPTDELGSVHQKYTKNSSIQKSKVITLVSIMLALTAFLIFLVPLPTKLRKIFISLLLVLVVFIPILGSSRAPMGWLIEFFAVNFPLYVFRRPPTYMFIIHFVYAIFVAGFVYWLTTNTKVSKIKKATIISLILSIILIINHTRILGNASFMNLKPLTEMGTPREENLFITSRFTTPEYVKNVANYINLHAGEFSVIILPVTGPLKAFDWKNYDGGYFGFDPYSMLISKPTNSDASFRHKGLFKLNNLIEDSIIYQNYKNLNYWFKKHNVKFVVIDLNTIESPGTNNLTVRMYISFMNKFPYKKKHTIGDSLIYELDHDGFIFNAVDEFKFKNFTENLDLNKIAGSNGFSIIDLNSFKINNFEQSSNNFSKIIINQISKISPSEYEIDISPKDLKKNPAFLSSTFFYNDKWNASINNFEIPKVNISGFSGWAIEPTVFSDNKNVTLKIKYIAQDTFNFLFYLSVTLFSLLCIFIITTNRRAKDD